MKDSKEKEKIKYLRVKREINRVLDDFELNKEEKIGVLSVVLEMLRTEQTQLVSKKEVVSIEST